MQKTLEEILALQRHYSRANTPEMQLRGSLIRDTLPAKIREIRQELAKAMGAFGADADAEGRDSTGLKAWVPWVRWHSTSRSPAATEGWYVVFLFHADASGVSMCLSHGSTTMKGGSFVKRDGAEVEKVVEWGLGIVAEDFAGDADVRAGVSLGAKGLGPAYERTTLFSKFYEAGSIPPDDIIKSDLIRFVRPLARLYEGLDKGGQPGSPSPEARDLESYVAPLSSGSKGQGRGLSATARRAVETAAMARAREWLRNEGFRFRDVSARDSCDFRATRNGEEWVVEVKGTTGTAGSVLLTRNEVDLHRESHPKNVLLIVHSLCLCDHDTKAVGGELVVHSPWQMDENRLRSICYEYRLD